MLMVPEILQVVIVGLMIVIPVILIYKKAGLNPLWAGLVFLPGFGLLLIFLQLALMDWPNAKRGFRS
ncbi:MAG: hypothetical protein KGZ80_08725 [Methylomonas sp.]|nr:hypothetical protein [Methylomonas sp.]PPD19974.1 MAG: hypothetical protein CTY23_10235 [Methylomonas sp.]PPD26536.1 MAG: hypothetical protein CTY22_04970 [Methylomonas sp.]PPD36938.1 MAG: hypothetical protein CTY17_10915 [Methylomonas sp.]PPD38303.1 MAG: hypothetical protein CTY21_04965 [Methylomonas sp.]